jgi:hypothetical protein
MGSRLRFNLLTISVTLLGLVLVGGGYAIQRMAYWADFAEHSGSELILVIPLLLVGRRFENRLRKTEENTRETAGSIAAVRAHLDATVARIEAQADLSLSEQLRSQHVVRTADFARASSDPQYQAVAGLFAAASRTRSIGSAGVRIRVPDTDLRFRFTGPRPDRPDILIGLEDASGSEVFAEFSWKAGESRAQATRRIGAGIRTAKVTGEAVRAQFAGVLGDLVNLLNTAIASKSGESALDLGSVIELPNSQWAVSEEGVRGRDHPAGLSIRQLLPSLDEKSLDLLLRKPWVDQDKLLEAVDLARLVLSVTAP